MTSMTPILTVNPVRNLEDPAAETRLTNEEEWYRRVDSKLQSCIVCLICTIVMVAIVAAIIFAKR